MMETICSLHCGHFTGVDPEMFKARREELEELFSYVGYVEETGALEVTGARDLEDHPRAIGPIFDMLSMLLTEMGRGSIILRCEGTEVCYFRKNMWSLQPMPVPPDPFDSIRHAGQG
jgi:hypothetical protein